MKAQQYSSITKDNQRQPKTTKKQEALRFNTREPHLIVTKVKNVSQILSKR